MQLYKFAKRSTAADYLLLFMVCAATSILLTRLYLYLLDYPQLTRGNIHFAHIIFGGSFMAIANLIVLTIHGRRARQFAAVIGGVGFGEFIDELGKFVTKDNNYFYRPAPVFIYFCFVILFFLYRNLDKYTPIQPKEVMYEVLERMEDIVEGKYYAQTKRVITEWLAKLYESSDPHQQAFAEGIEQIISHLPFASPPPRRYVHKIRSSWKWLEDFTTERKPVFYVLLGLFCLYIVNSLTATASFLNLVFYHHFAALSKPVALNFEVLLVAIQLTSQTASALIMVRGFYYLVSRRRQRALELFRTGLGINILLTQMAMFYFKQFSAAFDLLLMLSMFFVVHNLLEEEK